MGPLRGKSVQQLLILLSVIQTCEYRRVNALRFLLSGDQQLRRISDSDCAPEKALQLARHDEAEVPRRAANVG